MRTDFVGASPPGRIASSISASGRGAHRRPGVEALAQAAVGDVAVAVVGVLRQHRQDQLVDRRAVGLRHRAAVLGAQPVADRAHAALVGRLPHCARQAYGPDRKAHAGRGAAHGGRRRRGPLAPRGRRADPLRARRRRPPPGTGCHSSSAPAASRPTCRASAAPPSRPTSTTRSPATTASSSASPTTAGLERFSLVVHDWGGVGLLFAQRFPERIERLVVFGTLPLMPGYRWHRVARALAHAAGRRAGDGLHLQARLAAQPARRRSASARGRTSTTAPSARSSSSTARRRSRCCRSSATRLGELRCPALVLWPTDDPYSEPEFGQRYADALGGESELVMTDGGHWPWHEQPELVERVASFLGR